MSRARARTVSVPRDEIDFMVLEFSSVDSSVLSTLGQHCKDTRWKLAVGLGSAPVDIKLHVDKSLIGSPQVRVEWDGKKVFPGGNAAKAKLTEDFTWCVPFRGMIRGLNVKDYFEIRSEHHGDAWYTATLIDQREDGLFKATAQIPDGRGGTKYVNYPAVKAENIREAEGTKNAVLPPHRVLVLKVPREDPLHGAVLYIDDSELITHFFARPTPPPSKEGKEGVRLVKPRILFRVNQDRSHVSSDAGHATLAHFLRGDVRSIRQEGTKWWRSWTFQLGPFAEHTVGVEKKYKTSKLVTLTVDGDMLCESLAEDIDSGQDLWECRFRLLGERYLDWEVYEQDLNGHTLDTTDVVRQKHKYAHECVVSLQENEKDMGGARLIIDGVGFWELPEAKSCRDDERLECAPEALQGSYGLIAPYKVNESALMGFSAWTSKLRDGKIPSRQDFFRCCGSTPLGKEDVIRRE